MNTSNVEVEQEFSWQVESNDTQFQSKPAGSGNQQPSSSSGGGGEIAGRTSPVSISSPPKQQQQISPIIVDENGAADDILAKWDQAGNSSNYISNTNSSSSSISVFPKVALRKNRKNKTTPTKTASPLPPPPPPQTSSKPQQTQHQLQHLTPTEKKELLLQEAREREEDLQRKRDSTRLGKFKQRFSAKSMKQERKREEEAQARKQASTERWKTRQETRKNRFRAVVGEEGEGTTTESSGANTGREAAAAASWVKKGEDDEEPVQEDQELDEMINFTSSILGDLELMAGEDDLTAEEEAKTPNGAKKSVVPTPLLASGKSKSKKSSSRRLFSLNR